MHTTAMIFLFFFAWQPRSVVPSHRRSKPTLTRRSMPCLPTSIAPNLRAVLSGVIENHQLTYANGYGMASLEHGMPIDENTVFYTGSVSKQFAAAAVAMAAREEYLSLEDDLRKWFPELPDYGETITVKHLVHHTSGLRDYLGLMALSGVHFENVSAPTGSWI